MVWINHGYYEGCVRPKGEGQEHHREQAVRGGAWPARTGTATDSVEDGGESQHQCNGGGSRPMRARYWKKKVPVLAHFIMARFIFEAERGKSLVANEALVKAVIPQPALVRLSQQVVTVVCNHVINPIPEELWHHEGRRCG